MTGPDASPTLPYSQEQVERSILTLAADLQSQLDQAQQTMDGPKMPEKESVSELSMLRTSWPQEQQDMMQAVQRLRQVLRC